MNTQEHARELVTALLRELDTQSPSLVPAVVAMKSHFTVQAEKDEVLRIAMLLAALETLARKPLKP